MWLAGLSTNVVLAALKLKPRVTSFTVNAGTNYQKIDGFGFSQAFGRPNDL
jgi:hypothetical protein